MTEKYSNLTRRYTLDAIAQSVNNIIAPFNDMILMDRFYYLARYEWLNEAAQWWMKYIKQENLQCIKNKFDCNKFVVAFINEVNKATIKNELDGTHCVFMLLCTMPDGMMLNGIVNDTGDLAEHATCLIYMDTGEFVLFEPQTGLDTIITNKQGDVVYEGFKRLIINYVIAL